MEPKYNIHDLAIYYPRFAYGLVVGVPVVPFVVDIPLQFSSSTVNAPPIVQSFDNNLTSDTLVQRISYNLSQPNSFPGSPFRSQFFNAMKQSGSTGIGVQLQTFAGSKWAWNDEFTDLGTMMDVFAMAWPYGLMLPKQSNVKVSAILLETPTSVPFGTVLTFMGLQLLDKAVESISDSEARARLRKLGIASPDLDILLTP